MAKMRGSKLSTDNLVKSLEEKEASGVNDIPAAAPPKPQKKKGRPKVLNAKGHRINVYLNDDEYAMLMRIAEKTRMPLSMIAREAILRIGQAF